MLKAGELQTGQPQYVTALSCVDTHIRKRSGHRLLFWKR